MPEVHPRIDPLDVRRVRAGAPRSPLPRMAAAAKPRLDARPRWIRSPCFSVLGRAHGFYRTTGPWRSKTSKLTSSSTSGAFPPCPDPEARFSSQALQRFAACSPWKPPPSRSPRSASRTSRPGWTRAIRDSSWIISSVDTDILHRAAGSGRYTTSQSFRLLSAPPDGFLHYTDYSYTLTVRDDGLPTLLPTSAVPPFCLPVEPPLCASSQGHEVAGAALVVGHDARGAAAARPWQVVGEPVELRTLDDDLA